MQLRHKNWRREPIDQLALLVRQMSEDLDRIYRSVASFLVDLTALRGSSLNTIQLSHCARDWAFQTRSPPCHQVCQFRADTLLALDAVSARASRFRQTLLLTRAKTFHLNATIAQELAQQLDHIIWFEALFSATNSAVAIGFLVFGLYGMNFRNGFEEVRAPPTCHAELDCIHHGMGQCNFARPLRFGRHVGLHHIQPCTLDYPCLPGEVVVVGSAFVVNSRPTDLGSVWIYFRQP